MSGKTHTTGFRLGVTQPSSIQLQCYGEVPYVYSLLIIKLYKISDLLKRTFITHGIYVSSIESIIKHHTLESNVFYTSFENTKKSLPWINKSNFKENSKIMHLIPHKAVTNWMKNSYKVRFYRVHWLYSPQTLVSWIINQFEQKQSTKNILKLLSKELIRRNQWCYGTKSFISGTFKFSLTGIKVVCCGRLGGKQQRMSSKISKQLGIMPLQTLHAYVEYEKNSLYTRFGKIGIHVYYYYSKSSHV